MLVVSLLLIPVNMSYSILVVDDDPYVRSLVENLLICENYNVLLASNGEEAIEIVYKKPVDLILLDIMMPGINGFEVCKRLKSQRKYNLIPVIMLTALKGDTNILHGIRTGADEYIIKPFDNDELCERIKLHLQENKRLKEDGLLEKINFTIESTYIYLRELNEFITQLFLRTSLTDEEISDLKIAFLELGMNAIEHGNKSQSDRKVFINYSLYKDKLVIGFKDEGEGFNSDRVPNPTEDINMFSLRGRGIHLVRNLMDELEYIGKGNEVLMTKYLTFKSCKETILETSVSH